MEDYKMSKTKLAELSNEDFLVLQLRDISEHPDSSPSLRLQVLDRLALIAGIYRVGKRAPRERANG